MEKFSKFVLISSFLLLLLMTGSGFCANILFYFGISSYSHRIAAWPLVEELAARGHKVTFLSPFPPKKPNPKVTEITPSVLAKLFEDDQNSILQHRLTGKLQDDWEALPMFGILACETLLNNSDIQKWIKSVEFDLVVIDGLFNECGYGLAYLFKAKTILFSTTSASMWQMDIFGAIPETSWIPEMNYFYKEPMTFLQRVHNTFIPLYWHLWIRRVNYFPELETIMRKELDVPKMPGIEDLEKDTSLIFLNAHSSIEYARSLPPIFVSVGGMHIVESHNPLPKDMAKFVDESGPGGVIYVSFGSYFKASTMPTDIRDIFYKVFANFKSTRFIWKFDSERPKDMPENIMTADWVPQQELLAHKKIKAFISHGGLLGIEESTYYGVPMIVFPLFAEQDFNANLIQKTGRGIKLEIVGIQNEDLHAAIAKILKDSSYKSKMTATATLFKDRPLKPLETAVWWTEYVLRHDDVSLLKPLSMSQTWYERRLLDVWLFLFSVLFMIVFIPLYLLIKYCCSKKKYLKDSKENGKKLKKS